MALADALLAAADDAASGLRAKRDRLKDEIAKIEAELSSRRQVLAEIEASRVRAAKYDPASGHCPHCFIGKGASSTVPARNWETGENPHHDYYRCSSPMCRAEFVDENP